jgi:Zn-finger nucleic acid-binding protein
MTEYDEAPIKADRCDSCHGIFFDNGELEAVLLHHDEQRDAGKKGWFSSLLGKR